MLSPVDTRMVDPRSLEKADLPTRSAQQRNVNNLCLVGPLLAAFRIFHFLSLALILFLLWAGPCGAWRIPLEPAHVADLRMIIMQLSNPPPFPIFPYRVEFARFVTQFQHLADHFVLFETAV